MADEADQAQSHIEASIAMSLKSMRQEFQSVEVNTTGICIDCDNPIGEARLHAIPTTKRCIYCQKQYEASQ